MSLPDSQDGFWEEMRPILEYGYRAVPIRARTPVWRGWPFGRVKEDGTYARSSATTNPERLIKVFGGATPPGDHKARPSVAFPMGQKFPNGLYSLALDIDARRGGLDRYQELVAEIGAPPLTATVETRSQDGSGHIWLMSTRQWHGLPFELARGIEVKRAGQFIVGPPSLGYRFANHLAEVGVAHWPALDAKLDGFMVSQPVAEPERTEPAPAPVLAWREFDDCLLALSSASEGNRSQLLLSVGGKAAWLQAVGRGLDSSAEFEAALRETCRSNGLLAFYGERETSRKLDYVFQLADPATNPFLRNSHISPSGGRGCLKNIGPLRDTDAKVLLAVLGRCGWSLKHPPVPFAKRYGESKTGIPRNTVGRALDRLVEMGLLELGPPLRNPGTKSTRTYRPTLRGKEIARKL